MKVIDFLKPERIVANINARTKAGVLAELASHMAAHQPGVDAESLRKVLEERELLASTAIGDGIAIPHGKMDAVGQLVGALGRSVDGIDFESIDEYMSSVVSLALIKMPFGNVRLMSATW